MSCIVLDRVIAESYLYTQEFSIDVTIGVEFDVCPTPRAGFFQYRVGKVFYQRWGFLARYCSRTYQNVLRYLTEERVPAGDAFDEDVMLMSVEACG